MILKPKIYGKSFSPLIGDALVRLSKTKKMHKKTSNKRMSYSIDVVSKGILK